MKFSAGSRSFLRYGYGDLLREDRKWGVLHRIWPGTQRLLLWGDPLTAAAHSRAFSFCGSDGVEIWSRCRSKAAAAPASRATAAPTPTRRCARAGIGRNTTTPIASGDAALQSRCRSGNLAPLPARTVRRCELRRWRPRSATASRILPIVTTAHAPSAGEQYLLAGAVPQSIAGRRRTFAPYTDTPRRASSATSARSIRNCFPASTNSPTSC